MDLNTSNPSHKVHIPYWLLSLCALVVVLLMATLAQNLKKDKSALPARSQNANRLTDQPANPNTYFEQIGKEASKEAFVVKSWNVLGADVPTATTSARIYPLLHNITLAQAQPYVDRMLGNESLILREEAGAYVASEGAVQVKMEPVTGWFEAQMEEGIALPPGVNSDLSARAISYAQNLIGEDTLMATAEYTKRGEVGVKYVEIHRDWTIMGLPIINLQELLPYSARLSLEQWTQVPQPAWTSLISSNDAIARSSDGLDAKARIDGVNSIVVGIKNDRIISIVSRMRLRDMGQSEQRDEVLPALEALTKVTRSRFDQLVAQQAPPTGSDESPVSIASGVLMNARILQARLMYIEQGSATAQQALVPTYVFQGEARTAAGQVVHFLTTVMAPVHEQDAVVDNSNENGD